MATPVELLNFNGFPVALTSVDGHGRGLVATRDIKGGEVILQESPLLIVVDEKAKQLCCSNCFRMPKPAGGALPHKCEKCQEVYFCSPECLEAATSTSHSELVCSALQNLKASDLTDEERDQVRFLTAALDLPLQPKEEGGPKPLHLLLNLSGSGEPSRHRDSLYMFLERAARGNAAVTSPRSAMASPKAGSMPSSPMSFRAPPTASNSSQEQAPAVTEKSTAPASTSGEGPAPGAAQDVVPQPTLPPIATGSINRRFIAALLAKDKQNSYGLMADSGPEGERRLRASAIYPRCSLINHDCLPNVARFDYIDKTGTQNTDVQIRALHDIPAGTEIHQSYFPIATPYYERQQRLLEEYGFDCNCKRCGIEAMWSDGDDDDSEDEDIADSDEDEAHKSAAAVAPDRAAEEISSMRITEQAPGGEGSASDLKVVGKGKGKVTEEEEPEQENDFEHAIFFVKYLCPVEGCGGTMVPEAGKWTGAQAGEGEYIAADRMECNMCGKVRTDEEFKADLEAHHMAEELDED